MRKAADITLVLGGASSGKSKYAEALAGRFASVTYIATARAGDRELERRVEEHKQRRPNWWSTVEVLEPKLPQVLEKLDSGAAIVDGITLYVAQVMESTVAPEPHLNEVVEAVQKCPAGLILVSDEIGWGLVPETEAARFFRELLGKFNQRLAEVSTNVYLVAAGLPVKLK